MVTFLLTRSKKKKKKKKKKRKYWESYKLELNKTNNLTEKSTKQFFFLFLLFFAFKKIYSLFFRVLNI